MRVMETVSMAWRVSARLGAHLHNLDSVTVFVLSPVSGTAVRAFWLDKICLWMLF